MKRSELVSGLSGGGFCPVLCHQSINGLPYDGRQVGVAFMLGAFDDPVEEVRRQRNVDRHEAADLFDGLLV